MQAVLQKKKSSKKPAVLFCEECGASGAVKIEKYTLCVDCYSRHGSGNSELGKNDLWRGNTKC